MTKSLKSFTDIEQNKLYSYNEYLEESQKFIENNNPESLSNQDKTYYEYTKINLQRTKRVEKTFKPNQEIVELIEQISSPQTWLFVTEAWCGDSAQNIPYFFEYSKINNKIKVNVILRDSNLETIDSYFTEGNSRSIPKVVFFDNNGTELAQWGSRPKFAQDLVSQLKAEGYTKEEFNKELHTWYAKNRGKELEKEILEILKKF